MWGNGVNRGSRLILPAATTLACLLLLAIGIGSIFPWEFCVAHVSNGQWSVAADRGRLYFLRIGENGDASMALHKRDPGNPPVVTHHFLGLWSDGQFAWEFDLAGLAIGRTWYEWRVSPGEGSNRPCHALVFPFWWILLAPVCLVQKGWRRHLSKVGYCSRCNYDLRAHAPGSNCPECGTPVPKAATIKQSKRSPS
jgi:hypothetical protein